MELRCNVKYWVFYVRLTNIYRVSFDTQVAAEKFAKDVKGTVLEGKFVKDFNKV
jgi:hypothetical protein